MGSFSRWFREGRAVLLAWLVVLGPMIAFSAYRFRATGVDEAISNRMLLIAAPGQAVWAAYVVGFVRVLLGRRSAGASPADGVRPAVGGWGLAWRSLIVLVLTALLIVPIGAVVGLPGPGALVLLLAAALVFPPLLAWWMFGRRRWADAA